MIRPLLHARLAPNTMTKSAANASRRLFGADRSSRRCLTIRRLHHAADNLRLPTAAVSQEIVDLRKLAARALTGHDLTLPEFLQVASLVRFLVDQSDQCDGTLSTIQSILRPVAGVCERSSPQLCVRILSRLSTGPLVHGAVAPTLATLARDCRVATHEVQAVLGTLTGSSLRQCLRACRVRAVLLELATTDEQVAQIGYRLGYQWPHHIDRDMRAVCGVSPRVFRRLVR